MLVSKRMNIENFLESTFLNSQTRMFHNLPQSVEIMPRNQNSPLWMAPTNSTSTRFGRISLAKFDRLCLEIPIYRSFAGPCINPRLVLDLGFGIVWTRDQVV